MKKLLIIGCLFCFCQATCKTAAKDCVENQKPDCMCTMQYDPVCGCNKITYGNACVANCAGITKFIKGACAE